MRGGFVRERTEMTNSFHRHRGNRRKQDWKKARKKFSIVRQWSAFHDCLPEVGRLRKGKIHCSCFMCRAKTNHRKMKRGSDRYRDTWSVRDLRKMDSMRDQIVDVSGAVGSSWEEVQAQLFTPEEIAESYSRIKTIKLRT